MGGGLELRINPSGDADRRSQLHSVREWFRRISEVDVNYSLPEPPFLANVISWVWLLLEVALRLRDRRRGAGSTVRDAGTRNTIMLTVAPAVLVAALIGYWPGLASATALPGYGGGWLAVVGPAVMFLGLGTRVWAICTLGRSFRTTVEIDPDQTVIDRGPYRWTRHPSYSGVLLLALGYGIAMGSWLAVTVTVVVPVAVLMRRIAVEEHALIETLGDSYEIYRRRTARLVPGVW